MIRNCVFLLTSYIPRTIVAHRVSAESESGPPKTLCKDNRALIYCLWTSCFWTVPDTMNVSKALVVHLTAVSRASL